MFRQARKLIAGIIVFLLGFYPQGVYALPQGGTVVGGSADPFNYSGDTLTVTQNSGRLATDWQSFSIGQPETVQFNQPDASSIALNRVIGDDPSRILGTLSADGKVFLINPNGIVFGVNSVVDTAGLLASTLNLDMSIANFISGSNDFTFSGPGGAVVNYGNICLNQPGGYVALLGTSVKNAGFIEANLGKVILAAGEQMTLDLDPAGLISVAVDVAQGTDRNDESEYAAVNNVGEIVANGGQVVLSADVIDSVFTSAVNNDGVIEAGSLEEMDGFVLLKSNQNIELNGEILASGAIDAQAQENIILGKPINDTVVLDFAWEYLGGDRSYEFREFGYYYGDGVVRVMLSRGEDIGKDAGSPLAGEGLKALPGQPLGLYATFDTTFIDDMGLVTYFQDPLLNPQGLEHLEIDGIEYAWEDMYTLGDQDFNDALINFTESFTTVEAPDAMLSAPNIFLTAENGSISQQSGDVFAENLMLSSNTGVSGTGSNTGLEIYAENLSAVNRTSGHLRLNNHEILVIADLSGVSGLNTGVTGFNGVTNNAFAGEVNIEVEGEVNSLHVNAPVHSFGPVVFSSEEHIFHADLGDVTIHNAFNGINPPSNLSSPSHEVGALSLDPTIDVVWGLPENEPGFGFTGTAGGWYVMSPGSEILSNDGNVNMTAGSSAVLSLVDAQNGNVSVTAQNGSISDGDFGVPPDDYDVIAHNIRLSAPNGSVGCPTEGWGMDLGHPYEFSFMFDNVDNSDPDLIVDSYETAFSPSTGEWSFATTSDELSSGNWWFHVSAFGEVAEQTVVSNAAHLGPFVFVGPSAFWEEIEQELRVYYEILSPSQFLSFEPATSLGLYAYHPLTPTDSSAFDEIVLDEEAYEFIEDNIRMKKEAAPYFGL